MRYWVTLDAICKRIVRVTSDLNVSMRIFCYTFVLGVATRPQFPIKIGFVSLDQSLIDSLALPIFSFILLDIVHPLIYLIALHIVQAFYWKKYKKYDGKESEKYSEDLDKTELIIESHPAEIFGINILPSILLTLKIVTVILIVYRLIFNLQFA